MGYNKQLSTKRRFHSTYKTPQQGPKSQSLKATKEDFVAILKHNPTPNNYPNQYYHNCSIVHKICYKHNATRNNLGKGQFGRPGWKTLGPTIFPLFSLVNQTMEKSVFENNQI